ncbi:trifunctional nucleotide phosphoesterase protein YfkN-like [Rhopilema esculentum]|uniref:trifunctional nucleotide phosphoesterase protein YfkN-like n=1 Tax=Rhopilema esculentum TaxID=499914 RepID=UPI0031D48C51
MGLGCSSAKSVQAPTKHEQRSGNSVVANSSIIKTETTPQCNAAIEVAQQQPLEDLARRSSYEACDRSNSNSNHTRSCNNSPERDSLTIIHFNDVYNIEPRDSEPMGGAARFVTMVKELSDKDPLILFSGDCLNPSLMSTVTKGRQMIPILNKIGVHAALYGNHDFDFGVDELIQFKKQTKFPWLLSNVADDLTDDFLAEGVEKLLLDWQGRKVGIIGLIEEEWLVTLASVDPRDVTYEDFVECGRRLADTLRKEGADLIIALTHMRVPNDVRLLESDADIDLILGGHDHHYEVKKANEKILVKSGSDFKEFSRISVHFDENSNRHEFDVVKVTLDSSVKEDEEINGITDEFLALIEGKMESVLGNVPVDLDGRFSIVRTQESNLGNFIADIMRMAMQTDVAILNGGSLRSDRIHQAGCFTLKDLVSILPMMDILVVIAVTGENLIEALENGVSQYPRHEGRFPQVSGVQFSFNPDLPAGQRILRNSVKVNGQSLDWKLEYRVCVKSYLAKGKDGYDIFKSCKQLVNEENGQILPTIVQNHFESLKIISGLRKSVSGHRQSVTLNEDVGISTIIERERCRLEPKVEGRIRIAGLGVEKQDESDAKARPASPKPRGRTTRLKSVSAPSASLMGLLESSEEINTSTNFKNVSTEDNVT